MNRDARFPNSICIALAVGIVTMPARAAEIIHDFRTESFDSKRFRFEGPGASQFIKPEAKGLHWRFADGKAPEKPVGVYWNSRVQGDFAVTVQYEIKEITKPQKGNGVGVELYLMLDGPSKDGISLSRVEPSDGLPTVRFLHLTTDTKSGKRYSTLGSRTAATLQASERGRLRLVRTGTTLVASWSEGDNPEFWELQRTDVPATDLKMARFAGISGSDPNAKLDMLLLEYRMGDPGSPNMQVVTVPAPPIATPPLDRPHFPQEPLQSADSAAVSARPEQLDPNRFRGPLVIVGVVCLGSGLVLWLISKRKTAIATNPDDPASPPTPSDIKIVFECTACGKRLKTTPDKLGHSIKCPACGTVVPVPQ